MALNVGVLRSANRQRWTDYTREVARQTPDVPWLLVELPEDDAIAFALSEQGKRTRLISLARLSQLGYAQYLSDSLGDLRMKELARVSGWALLREWFQHPDAGKELCTLRAGLWRTAGRGPLPLGVVCTVQDARSPRPMDSARCRPNHAQSPTCDVPGTYQSGNMP